MVLIIYAHPDAEGFNSRILGEVENILKARGREYEVLNLYEINYDPVLKEEELYTAGNRGVSEENRAFQKKIGRSSEIIFIYPVWWGGMPAILKGFMDRVFTPGFAFKYRRDKLLKFIPDKYLTDKRVACFVTSGAPRFLYFLLLNPVKTINKFIIFGFFGAKSKTFQIYKATKLSEGKEKEIKKTVSRGVRWLLR
jgi:NAD(P)H dehydrogenase (quinone)